MDDDPNILKAYALCFKNSFEIEVARSGEEAVHALRSGFDADVIITDLCMPGMGGDMLASACRVEFPSVPVIVVSGERDGLERANAVGAAGFLLKPVDLDTIMSTIRMHIGLSHTSVR